MSATQPKKIAVFGGGLAAMTAVYHLTKDRDWKSKYDITIYQLGWRIGGKGGSGINAAKGNRPEEHGLHLWMGFYENAFTMMREAYAALNRPPGAPLATFDDAFKGQPYFIFEDYVNGDFIDWKINFPNPAGKVGDGHVPQVPEILANLLYMMWQVFNEFQDQQLAKSPLERDIDWLKEHIGISTRPVLKDVEELIPQGLKAKLFSLEKDIKEDIDHEVEVLLLSTAKLFSNLADYEDFSDHVDLLQNILKYVWDLIGRLVEENNVARRVWYSIDFGIAMMSGLFRDHVVKVIDGQIKLDFELINCYDYKEWLAMHGADQNITLQAPFIISMYDGPFAFVRGNANNPSVEAGTILNIFLRLAFTCKENFVWRMSAAMGDTIFAPFYELLTRDGKAKFKFFHKLKNLHLSADKSTIESISIGRQVTLKTDEYYPLVNVQGLDCWPSIPNYEYIVDEEAAQLKADNIDLESSWTPWQDREVITLQKGVDYDEIILGVSLAGMPFVAPELIDASPAWRKMLEEVQTVQTQAYQFWFNQDATTLQVEEDKLLSCYVEPVDTFAAMNQLLPTGPDPDNKNPKYLSFLCGAAPDANLIMPHHVHSFPQQEYDRMKAYALEYLQKYFQHLMPGLYDANNQVIYDYFYSFDGAKGQAAFDNQYFRINIDPSERYVLSVKNSSKYRLRTDQSGFDNLYLTGDWIQNGLNAGFVEGGVTSGILTARAVSGDYSIPLLRAPWEMWQD